MDHTTIGQMRLEYGVDEIVQFYNEYIYRLSLIGRHIYDYKMDKYMGKTWHNMVIGCGDIFYKVQVSVYGYYNIGVCLFVILRDISGDELYSYKYNVNNGHRLGYVNRLFDRVAGIADLDGMKALRRRLVHDWRKYVTRRRQREITGVDV